MKIPTFCLQTFSIAVTNYKKRFWKVFVQWLKPQYKNNCNYSNNIIFWIVFTTETSQLNEYQGTFFCNLWKWIYVHCNVLTMVFKHQVNLLTPFYDLSKHRLSGRSVSILRKWSGHPLQFSWNFIQIVITPYDEHLQYLNEICQEMAWL